MRIAIIEKNYDALKKLMRSNFYERDRSEDEDEDEDEEYEYYEFEFDEDNEFHIHCEQLFASVCSYGDLTAVETMLKHGVSFNCSNEDLLRNTLKYNNAELLRLIASYRPSIADLINDVICCDHIGMYAPSILRLYTKNTRERNMLRLMYGLKVGNNAGTTVEDCDYEEFFDDTNQCITDKGNKVLAPLQYCLQYIIFYHNGHNDINKVKWLLRMKADVNAVDTDGKTALMAAADCCDGRDICALLLDAKANVDAADNDGITALMLSIHKNEACGNTFNMLLNAKANVNAKTSSGETALMWAAKYSYDCMISDLLNANADVNARDNDGNTALSIMSHRINRSQLQLLLDSKVDINATDARSALNIAIRYSNDPNIVKYILDAKADVNAATRYDMTPMSYLVKLIKTHREWERRPANYIRYACMLIDAKADVNELDAESKNALLKECIKYNSAVDMRALLNAVKQANAV